VERDRERRPPTESLPHGKSAKTTREWMLERLYVIRLG
jgi:hypothetical protein